MKDRRGDWLVVRSGPDRALKIPKAVWGKTMDMRSLRVKSQIVLRWKNREEFPVS